MPTHLPSFIAADPPAPLWPMPVPEATRGQGRPGRKSLQGPGRGSNPYSSASESEGVPGISGRLPLGDWETEAQRGNRMLKVTQPAAPRRVR